MEHIHAGIFVTEFQNAALSLSLNDGVCEFGGRETGASGVVLEEIRMQMEGVDQIEFEDVDEVDANLFADFDLNGMVLIVKWNGVDGVKVVCVIEVNVECRS